MISNKSLRASFHIKTVSLLLASFLTTSLIWATTENTAKTTSREAPVTERELIHALEEVLAQKGLRGVSVALTSLDRMVVTGVGLANEARGLAMGPDTRIRVASVSKLIPTLLAAIAIEQNRLGSIETTIFDLAERSPTAQLLKKHFGTDPRWQKMTLAHLLSHTSGLSIEAPYTTVWTDTAENQKWMSDAEFEKHIDKIELLFEPGKMPRPPGVDYNTAKYSNLNMNTLGRILGEILFPRYRPYLRLSGSELFERAAREYLFNRVQGQMPNTGYNIDPAERGQVRADGSAVLSDGHSNGQFTAAKEGSAFTGSRVPLLSKPRTYGPSAGLVSTARDMAHFTQWLLQETNTATGEVSRLGEIIASFSRSQSMLFPHVIFAQGFSWVRKKSALPLPLFGHIGSGGGERAIAGIYPDLGVGLALLFNGTQADRELTAQMVVEKFSQLVRSGKTPYRAVRKLLTSAQDAVELAQQFKMPSQGAADLFEEMPKTEIARHRGLDRHRALLGEYASPTGQARVFLTKEGRLALQINKIPIFKFLLVPTANPLVFRTHADGVFYNGEKVEFQMNEKGQIVKLTYALSKPLPVNESARTFPRATVPNPHALGCQRAL